MNLRIRRCFALLLALVLAVFLPAAGAYAAEDSGSYIFSLQADGQTATKARTGETVPVQLLLTNTGAEEVYDLYTMQDYVTFDRSFFELVEGSIQTLEGAGLTAGGLSFDGGAPDRIYINRTSPTPYQAARESVLLTFELRVIAESGSGSIGHDTYFVSRDGEHAAAAAEGASVTVGTRQYTITATAGAGGSISPAGAAAVDKGADQRFAITADDGYAVQDVLVDGESVGAVTEYTFENVRSDHSIAAAFRSVGGGALPGGGETEPPVEETPVEFSDVHEGDWFYDSVAYCVRHGLMQGVGDGRFDPYGTTTRAAVVTILWRMEGSPAASGEAFADVAEKDWFYTPVTWAAANGIVLGADGKFDPNGSVTREQLAVIFRRYADFKGLDTTQETSLERFADAGDISAWALPALRWANAAGLVNGKSETSIDPQGTASRAECAAILQRFCGKLA